MQQGQDDWQAAPLKAWGSLWLGPHTHASLRLHSDPMRQGLITMTTMYRCRDRGSESWTESRCMGDKAGIGTQVCGLQTPKSCPRPPCIPHCLPPVNTHSRALALKVPVQMAKHPRGAAGMATPISRPASPRFRRNQALQLESMPILAAQPKPWPVPPSTQDLGLLSILGVPGLPSQAPDRERSVKLCCHLTVGLWASSFAFWVSVCFSA